MTCQLAPFPTQHDARRSQRIRLGVSEKRKMREKEGDGKLRMSLCVGGSDDNGGKGCI